MARSATAPGIRDAKIGPWKGMNEKISPDMLPPGVAADLRNLLLDEIPGTAVKRLGTRAQAALPSGLPPRDTYVFTKLDGTSYQLVSDGVSLYSCTDPSGASFYSLLKTGLDTDGFMSFETAENKVWMSNGINPVMSWDGSTLLVFDRAFTSTTDLTTVDSTHIIHAGLSASDDYWNGMKLVFTAGANKGTVVSVTDYVESTKTLTFTPAVTGILATDRFSVGLIIPKGASLRFWDGHLFDGCTTDNQAELRFSEISDPDTGEVMTLDNPRAWPAANELALNVLDQERLWGITPVLRDRILVHKASGLWRLERDPLVIYRLELVSRAVGSRFPDTWAEKSNVLYFLGQDKDGFPDVYKTDMVEVSPVDPDGGVEPTLRGLQQPNATQPSRIFTSQSDFDSGSKSTGASSDSGQLGISGTPPVPTSTSNVDTAKSDATVGYHGLLGIPNGDAIYDAADNILPSVADVPWANTGWTLTTGPGQTLLSGGTSSMIRNGIFSTANNGFVVARMRTGVNGASSGTIFMKVSNGTKSAWVNIQGTRSFDTNHYLAADFSTGVLAVDTRSYHIYALQLRTDGTFSFWVDGVLAFTGTAATGTTTNQVVVGSGSVFTSSPGSPADPGLSSDATAGLVSLTRVLTSISSSGSIPSTILSTGNYVSQYDFTRAPSASRRVYLDALTGTLLSRCGTTTASITVQLPTTTDMSKFSVGIVVDFLTESTGTPVTNGSGRTIASIDAGAFTITVDLAVTTDSTTAVYFKQVGAATISTWSSDTSDFSSGNDPAGYVSVTNGAVTTSLAKRYLRVKISLIAPNQLNPPIIRNIYVAMLWTSPAVSIGSVISAWRTFLDSLSTPSGTVQTFQIRRATVTTAPAEGDWGAWFTIANGDNIGTILGDATPPTSRWVQLKVEQGPSSVGLLPYVDSLILQWVEGSSSNLPVRAVVHKKRYLLVAATAGVATNDIVIVLDRNDQWTKYHGLSLNALVHYKGNLYGLDAAAATQRLMEITGLYNDDGVAISAYLITREESFEAAHLRKNYRWSYIQWDRADAAYTLTTSYRRTGDSDFTGSGTFSFGATGQDLRQNFPIATVGKRIQRKYANAVLDENMALMGEVFYFDIRPVQP